MPAISSLITVDPFFEEGSPFIQPATFVNADGIERDIKIIMDEQNGETLVGETLVDNPQPTALCRKIDVYDAGNDCQLRVHDYLEGADGEPLEGADGERLIAENVASYKVVRPLDDKSGFVTLELSRD